MKLTTAVIIVAYIMIGLFVARMIDLLDDGPDFTPGNFVFYMAFWPLALIIFAIAGILSIPFILSEKLVTEIRQRIVKMQEENK